SSGRTRPSALAQHTAIAVAVLVDPPAQPVTLAGTVTVTGQGRGLHRVDRRIRQNRLLLGEMGLQMKHSKAHQIVRAAQGPVGSGCERLMPVDSCTLPWIDHRDVLLQPWSRADRGVSHPQGPEHLIPEEIGVALARYV